MEFERRVRYVEKILGCEIEVVIGALRFVTGLIVRDPDLDNRTFTANVARSSEAVRVLDRLHARVYRERSRHVWESQGKKCWACGKPINEWETDHIKSRARGERDDRVVNLRAVCGPGGCGFHARQHGG